ncbi:hypothetical protein G4D82_03950 [Flavobacterium sp. CYK-4]|uniref:beta strand repeat-containing protein n=1 Tax=Flavobacterium lotistagni TaxID=2709660 RepID=UPI00140CE487|nr:hypothetical protein [Flavobacterium lotistagni]NHM06363.1 hypothetical protein [Flavobacterium lotistagni]
MKYKLHLVVILFFMLQSVLAQVGIGTTTPNATFDVRSSNQAAPAHTDGILIPRVDAFPATNPTASQNGMLVFLTTTSGANAPGFYYWNQATTSWIGINSTMNSDADWHKVGTSTAPTLITDNMFHTGNVAIGKNTANFPLEIQGGTTDRLVNSSATNNTSNTIDNISISNTVNGSSTDNTYGILNTLSGTGTTGVQFGTANWVSNSGNSNQHGTYNGMSGSGSGNHYGVYSDITGTGTGKQYGSSINISNSSNAIHYGTNNNLSGSGSGIHYGVFTDMSGTGSGEQYGSYISVSNSGNAVHYGNYNDIGGTGNGNQFGSSININNSGTGVHYGNFTNLSGAGTGIQYGSSNTISNTGSGIHFGNFNLLSGTGTGLQYGTYNSITNSANVTHYGTFNTLDGAGTGLKYGSYNYINPSAGGTHYGIYSEVLKSGTNYAGYFLGNVSIGTTTLNNYLLPPSRGTNGQIMQTDGAGNVTWQNLNSSAWLTTGNSGTTPASNFIGTTDNQDIVFKRFNIRAGYIGDASYDGGFNYNNGNTAFGANSLVNPTISFASQYGVRNSAFGANVLTANTTGQRNTAMGDFALFSNTSGSENTAIGSGAMFSNTTSNFNVAIGRQAMTSYNAPFLANTGNTAVGFAALRNSVTGTNNVALGYEALRNTTGNGNIGIGFQAGRTETGSDKLYIENSNADANNALIYGDFSTNILRINGQVQVGNPTIAGYAFPTSRGSNTQVLQTDGAGATTWVNTSSLAITETDPKVNSAGLNSIPKWNGTKLVDGVAIDDGTNIGIGITPSAGNKLEVNGKTKTTNFQMTSGATNNAVLQSDAVGNASWVTPASMSMVRTNLSANQSLNTSGWQLLNFNTIVFDVNSEFNTGTNRFIALKTGYYEVNAGFHTDNQSNTQFYSIGIYKNGSLYQQTSGNHSNLGPVSRTIHALVYLTAGEYVEIFAENYQSGVNLDAYAGKTYFEVRQLR